MLRRLAMQNHASTCVFCARIAGGDVLLGDDALLVALSDKFPVSAGHALVVPRRHVASWLDLTPSELAHAWELVARVARKLDVERHPAGYNLGVNVGTAAGQTIEHAHLHVIPRYAGDVPDPRGGVRWIIPARAKYWNDEP